MKKPTILKAGLALCVLVLLNACKKEVSTSSQQENQSLRLSGVVPDDPALVAKVPLIVSSNYMNIEMQAAKKGKGGGTGGSTTGDITPPSVKITSPANGASVSGTVNVSISASDNVGVTSISLSVDGSVIGTVTSSSYTFAWNSSAAASGTHTLAAKATDAAGNYNTYSISVSINATVLPPPSSSLPSSYQLTMPPVGYQGGEASCAAFATVYAARSVEQFYKTNASSYSYATNILSPEFVYDQTKVGDCSSGTGVTTALEFMKSTGVCTWQSMPYSSTNGCSVISTSSQLAEAGNYKITSYSWLYASDQTTIKTMLLNKHVIIATIAPDQSFYDATAGFIWSAYSGGKQAAHSLVVCGYDDAKHAYKVMNSWGTSWGDAGYSWIDYDFFPYTGGGICYVITG